MLIKNYIGGSENDSQNFRDDGVTKLIKIHVKIADKKALHLDLSVQLELPYQIICERSSRMKT